MWKDRTDWDSVAEAQLREAWASGMSGEKIARAMGRTKNAVIGKIYRMKLSSRPSPIIRDGRIPQKSHKKGGGRGDKRPVARPVGGIVQEKASPELTRRLAELAASFAEREPPPPETRFQPPRPGSCLWPMWSGKATHEYCGCAAEFARPYCEGHARIAYVRGKAPEMAEAA